MAIVLVVIGCDSTAGGQAAQSAPSEPGEGQVASPGGTTVLVSEPLNHGMDALGGGRLEDVGGCLGANGSVVVWPNGTTVVDDDPLTVEIPGYGTYAVGQTVQVGGGFVLEHSSDGAAPDPFEVAGITVPAECAKYDVFLAQ